MEGAANRLMRLAFLYTCLGLILAGLVWIGARLLYDALARWLHHGAPRALQS
jgi:hypothetical protein